MGQGSEGTSVTQLPGGANLGEFVNKAKEGDWRSALGAGGLQIKQTIESVIGRQYPPLEKGKPWVNIILIKILDLTKISLRGEK